MSQRREPKADPKKQKALPAAALTRREREVMALIAAGCSNRQIASELVITLGTAKRHIANIYRKLGVHSRAQAVAVARETGELEELEGKQG